MKRLNVLLLGNSPVLSELGRLIDAQGHGVTMAMAGDPPVRAEQDAGLLVLEDGSLLPTPAWTNVLGETPVLRLRVSAAGHTASSALSIRSWVGTIKRQRLVGSVAIDDDPSGNGQLLRGRAVAALEAIVSHHLACFARDAGHLDALPTLSECKVSQEQGLLALEPLAYVHPFNDTVDTVLLQRAERGLLAPLEHALRTHAGRTAIRHAGQALRYQDLHALILGLQDALLPLLRIDGDEVPVVAVSMAKSPWVYASLVAVLGCAAVYLPIDPALPADRRVQIARDAQACVWLHEGSLNALAVPPGTRVLNVRDVAIQQTPRPSGLQRRAYDLHAPCVALYTSGTTGTPKGVLLSGYNLAHFCAWYAEHVALNQASRALQFASLGFDASLLDILPTFLCGATLIIPSDDERRDPELLLSLLQHEAVTHAFLPPALLSVLPIDRPLTLTHLITGGDVCEPQVIQRLAGQCRFHNIYGPTEATVLATTHHFGSGDGNRCLGRPIANTRVLLLDEQLRPVGQGTPGELYVCGPGVGLGYLRRPALTLERFVDLDWPGMGRMRAYRTGDIGQWQDSGLMLCGRRDNQVKIRGQRVELEEVEHCLRTSQAFAQVGVVVDAQQRLVAFVAQPDGADALERVRAEAERRLPGYMQPAFYHTLPVLPSTLNGKVDRAALLDLQVGLPDLDLTPPGSVTEQQLVALWAELLDLTPAQIAVDASFFNLGGHSILLSRLLLAIRERFGRGVAINHFIERPTVQCLAGLLDGSTASQQQTTLARLEQDAERPLGLNVLPLTAMGDVHKVIVTGANSFLGVHLIEALLQCGTTEVACLVRSTAQQTAEQRLHAALAANRVNLDLSRVRVFEADLRAPRLGLSGADYDYLDRHYGALLHNAAQVNHVLDYDALAADNVEPLFECLRLCEGRRKKIFNFISTLSACSAVDANGQVLEQGPAPTLPIYLRNGYNLSKWVGERIVQRARAEGVQVNLMRPGNITFDSRSGVCQPHRNRLMLMLKGSLQLGQVPQLETQFDLMPVDFLARFVAFHGSRHRAGRWVFNLHNPQPLTWRDYLAAFSTQGHAFDWVDVPTWQAHLHRIGPDNALYDIVGFYLDGFGEDIGDITAIDHANARAGLQQMGMTYPLKSPALLQRGCDYLSEIGFL